MGDSLLFTADGAWGGGHYSLAMIYRDATQAVPHAAIQALWNDSAVEGVYLESRVEPSAQQRLDHLALTPSIHSKWLGVLKIEGIGRVPCGMFLFLPDGEREAWLELNIPMGGLAHADRRAVGFPFGGSTSRVWRSPLDGQLARLATRVFDAAPFEIGFIGMEPLDRDYEEFAKCGQAPDERWVGWLIPESGKLHWLPPTIYDAPFK